MFTLLIVFVVAYGLAKLGQKLMRLGMEEEREYDQAAEDRMVQYRAWIRGDGRVRSSGCIDGEHAPMVLFNREDPSVVDDVICIKCTDTLPKSAALSCNGCKTIAVDGYLHVDACPEHEKEPVLS